MKNRYNIWKSCLLSTILIAGGGLTTWAVAETSKAEAKADDIAWQSDLNSALSDAKKQNKKILLRFSADWCPPCRVMDIRVWPDPSIQSVLTKNYIPVIADVDEESSKELARKYRLAGVPTLIILDSDGKELSRGSFMNSPELVKFLNSPE